MTRTLLALLALATLAVPRAGADVAGTGSFTVAPSGIPIGSNVDFEGGILFDDLDATPLATPVNLGTSVGEMTFLGTALVAEQPPSASFSLTATDPDSAFAFSAGGAGACDQPDCVGGTATFAGRFDSVTLGPSGLPTGVFTFDGTAALTLGGPAGVFGLNAFPFVLTPQGTDVSVQSGSSTYFDSRTQTTRTFEARVVYGTVSSAGSTTFAGLSSVPGSPPEGISLPPALSVFIDIETTATVSGPVQVCIAYVDLDGNEVEDLAGIPLAQLRLLHAALLTFVDVTQSVGEGRVCGTVDGLSPFVLGVSDSGFSTTTTISGGGTTTTTLPLGGCTEPVACLELALGEPLCVGEALNPKLQAIITAKLGKARTLLQKAGTVAQAKVAKLIIKARKQLTKVGTKADAFVTKKKGPISAGCRDGIRAALDQIGTALTNNPPTGGGGGGGSGVIATIPGFAAFQGSGYFYNEVPTYAEGCVKFPGSSECQRLITFVFENSPVGAPQTIVQPEFVVPLMTYSEYSSPSAVVADIVLSSEAGTAIVVDGLVNGRLQGRFSGPFRQTHPGTSASIHVEGTFNVPQKERPF